MSKVWELLKRWWPTVLPVVMIGFGALDSSVQHALVEWAKSNPTLASLITAIWIAIANWVHGLQVPSVKVAEKTLDKAIEKEASKG